MPDRSGLITTTELADILDQPDLRLFDGTTYLEYQPPGSGIPYIAVPGRHTFEASHIPGADFLDLQGEFSDSDTELRFMMPATAQLETAFGRHGIGANSRVVLYSIGTAMWATRFWWMLRSLGFENVSVLDGGLDKWKAEGRAIEAGPAMRPVDAAEVGQELEPRLVVEPPGQLGPVGRVHRHNGFVAWRRALRHHAREAGDRGSDAGSRSAGWIGVLRRLVGVVHTLSPRSQSGCSQSTFSVTLSTLSKFGPKPVMCPQPLLL